MKGVCVTYVYFADTFLITSEKVLHDEAPFQSLKLASTLILTVLLNQQVEISLGLRLQSFLLSYYWTFIVAILVLCYLTIANYVLI